MTLTDRYVRDDADGSGDGTTNANTGATGAWTFGQMLLSGATGTRFNIRSGSGGAYVGPSVTTVSSVGAVASGNKFTRASGSWITDGFVAGQAITSAGFATGGNNGNFVVSAVTATDLSIVGTLSDEAAEAGQTVIPYLVLPAGTATAPNVFQGFNSSAGDLAVSAASLRSNSGTGALVTTNYPVITIPARTLTTSGYNVLRNLKITGTYNGYIVFVNASPCYILECYIENTNAASGAACRAIGVSTVYAVIFNCDIYCSVNSTSAYAVEIQRGQLSHCRVSAPNTSAVYAAGLGNGIDHCVIFDSYQGIKHSSGSLAVTNCSFHDITVGCIAHTSATSPVVVIDCVAYDVKYLIDNQGSVLGAMSANNAVGGLKASGARTVNWGDWPDEINPITLTGDPYTNAAGGDFSINSTAGAGGACRSVGLWPYGDLGALQHQDAGGTPAATPNLLSRNRGAHFEIGA